MEMMRIQWAAIVIREKRKKKIQDFDIKKLCNKAETLTSRG